MQTALQIQERLRCFVREVLRMQVIEAALPFGRIGGRIGDADLNRFWQASSNSGPLDPASTAPWIRDVLAWLEYRRNSVFNYDSDHASDTTVVTCGAKIAFDDSVSDNCSASGSSSLF